MCQLAGRAGSGAGNRIAAASLNLRRTDNSQWSARWRYDVFGPPPSFVVACCVDITVDVMHTFTLSWEGHPENQATISSSANSARSTTSEAYQIDGTKRSMFEGNALIREEGLERLRSARLNCRVAAWNSGELRFNPTPTVINHFTRSTLLVNSRVLQV